MYHKFFSQMWFQSNSSHNSLWVVSNGQILLIVLDPLGMIFQEIDSMNMNVAGSYLSRTGPELLPPWDHIIGV